MIPTLTGLSQVVTFGESSVNAAARFIDGDVIFAGGSAGTLVVSGLLAEDVVSIRNEGTGSGQIGFSGGTITYQGITIGSATGGNGGPLTVNLTALATESAVDALLENLTYANQSDTPTASRTLEIHMTDGDGAALAPMVLEARAAAANPFAAIDIGAESSPFFVDFDGDGDLDLVVGALDGSLAYFKNAGTATAPVFAAQTGTDNPFDGIDTGGDSAAKPGLVDFDGDADLDLAVGTASGSIPYFVNGGTPGAPDFGPGTEVLSVGSHAAPTAVDLDADGDLDAVVGNAAGKLAYFRNVGTAAEAEFSRAVGAGSPFEAIDVGDRATPGFADFDGDGDFDLAVGASDGTVKFFENTGTATSPVFTERTGEANPFDGIDVGAFATPTLVDLDGDGDPDAVIGGDGGTLAYFENTATLAVVVNVTAENDAPVITSNGGGAGAAVTVVENSQAVTTVTASDPDNTPSFAIAGGSDAGRFTIDAKTGVLTFKEAADYEVRRDADGDNTYEVAVKAGDGKASDTQTIRVTVSNEAGLDLAGSKRGDDLSGSSEDDRIVGGKGNDKLSGLDAGDILDGGKGNDKLTGGLGEDSFVFNAKLKANIDTVNDFESGVDSIVLDDAVFKKLSPGPLSVEAFVIGKKAKDGDDHVLYNQKNGQLLYDQDGSDGKDALVFAKIGKGLDLDAHDFLAI